MRITDYDYKARNKDIVKDTPNLSIEDKINMFISMTVPKDASEIQVNETRKAFIAGMFQCFGDMMTISSMKEDFAEKQMAKYNSEINKAIEKYCK